MIYTTIKKLLRWLLCLIYKVEVRGEENFAESGERVLIVSNHISFLDPLLLGVFLPDKVTFAINTQIAHQRLIKPFLKLSLALDLSRVFEMDPTNPLSLKALVKHLQQDNKAVIFPEGRITVTGSLMKIYDGTGMVADKSKAIILPIRIDGAEYTRFSRLRNLVKLRLFPKITINILPPTKLDIPDDLHGKDRRKHSGRILADVMTDMVFITSHYRQTIFSALLEAKKIHGGKHIVAEDLERTPLDYNALITRTIILGNLVKEITSTGENVGVMLPNTTKTLNVVLGLQIHGRVPAMLNFSTGYKGMIAACKLAKVKTVLTSRRFIELGKLTEDAENLSQYVNLIYLEDLAAKINLAFKLKGLYQSKTAHYWYKHTNHSPESPAVILFTSGSEGTPKGVVLSHSNILANHKQLVSRISFTAQDLVLNVLPMFHSFGFSVGAIFPVLNGIRTFLYPTPLHYSVIPEIAYEKNATVLFSTNTFLAAYGRKAHVYDFYNVRYVFAGAEKLQESTRELWAEKFGIRIFEGYGATETSPIVSANTPMENKAGTVGRFMPGMDHKLEPVPGIEDAGKLHVAGPNIMAGYLLSDNPGKLVPPQSIYGEGWYDTGDIVHVDQEGYISIRGRSKRFAKISGEMVSLTAVEQLTSRIWPDALHAVVSLPDAKKGEQLILVTTQKDASNSHIVSSAKGVATINLPKKILVVDQLPLLATGKTDYPAVTELAHNKLI